MYTMKYVFPLLVWLLSMPLVVIGQIKKLIPGKEIHSKLMAGKHDKYAIKLKKGEYATCVVMQEGVDVAIDIYSPIFKLIKSFDSPNGQNGPEPVSFVADTTGVYLMDIYPTKVPEGMPEADRKAMDSINQGNYSIQSYKILSVSAYAAQLASEKVELEKLKKCLYDKAHPIKTVEAGNGFDDLQAFKNILKDATVVGLGEATHGTSEFFKMKHRMLEFLVKEMGFCSFYIEASMSRCRYINDYVLYGKGNLDTATAMQGFVTWRVDEVRDMIEWLRLYNKDQEVGKRVKFLGYDLQINDVAWRGLHDFYRKVKPDNLILLDTLESQLLHAAQLSNLQDKNAEGMKLYTQAYKQCIGIHKDIESQKVKYISAMGESGYDENLMNITLIIQEIESYKDGFNNKRDIYMAHNILYLLRKEKKGGKVVVWAHNDHISIANQFDFTNMGMVLKDSLKDKYYAIGFEFYTGSFQSRNIDLKNTSSDWDVNTIGTPPENSLPYYLNNTGKDMLYLDYHSMGSLRNFSKTLDMHSVGSMYSASSPTVYPATLKNFDGLIYIKNSTAAKNFKKVKLRN